MLDFEKVILAVAPHSKPAVRKGTADAMPWCINYASLNTNRRLGLFIGECAEESAGYTTTREFASGDEYQWRMGNVGYGWGRLYKGRGDIQLTGHDNYAAASRDLNVDFVGHPQLAEYFPYAAQVSAWFWKRNNINALADVADDDRAILLCTRHINGGTNGLSMRAKYVRKAWRALTDLNGTLAETADEEVKAAKKKAGTAAASTGGAIVAGTTTVPKMPAANQNGTWALVVFGTICAIAVVTLLIAVGRHLSAAKVLRQAIVETPK